MKIKQNLLNLTRHPAGFLGRVLLLLLPLLPAALILPATAGPFVIVVPNNLASAEGGEMPDEYPFDLVGIDPIVKPSIRYQQVYDAAQFSALPRGGASITRIAFRVAQQGAAFSATLPDVQINLSTTAKKPDGLSATFADNVGANDTIIFKGALPLGSTATGSPTRAFDIVINLTKPFLYDPAKGNLLLDVKNIGGGSTTWFDAITNLNDSVSRVYNVVTNFAVPPPPGPEGSQVDSIGLVTQFTFEPDYLEKILRAIELEKWQDVIFGQGCGPVIVFGPHGLVIGPPIGPGDPFVFVGEPVKSLGSLSPSVHDAVVAMVLGGLANDMKDAKTQKELRNLSIRFAREGLKNLKTEGARD